MSANEVSTPAGFVVVGAVPPIVYGCVRFSPWWILWIMLRNESVSSRLDELSNRATVPLTSVVLWQNTQYCGLRREPPCSASTLWQLLQLLTSTIVRRGCGVASVTANASVGLNAALRGSVETAWM